MNPSILLFFAVPLASVILMKKIGVNTMIAFALAGVIAGPAGLSLVNNYVIWEYLGDLGLAFLWFSLGLELGVRKIWSLRKNVFGIGALAVTLTLLLILPLLVFFEFPGWTLMGAAIVALILTISSSGSDLEILANKNELQTRLGRKAFSILIFQNILTIPILAMMPIFGGREFEIGAEIIDIGILTIMLILGMFLGARLLMNPFMKFISRLKSREAFLLTIALTVSCLSAAFALTGLPIGIGAFLAGILFAETLYNHQVKADIAPYQMMFIGLFFLTLGMGLDIPGILRNYEIVLTGAIGLILLKFIAIYTAARFYKASGRHAAITGLLLAQGGEFGLLILQTIKTYGIDAVPLGHQDIIKGIILLSMIITPILISILYSLNSRGTLYSKKLAEKMNSSLHIRPTVVIAGFGRVGKTIAKMLTDRKIEYVAIDMDIDEVEMGRRAGFNVVYGDTTRGDILSGFGLAPRTTRAVVVALDNAYAQKKTIRAVRRIAKNVKIFARAKNLAESKILAGEGAKLALPETIESSFLLATEVMRVISVGQPEIDKVLNDLRKNNYETMESIES